MNIISLEDERYPNLLKEIGKEAPKQIYLKGEWSEDIFKNCLAVVGSRHITSYGKRVVEQIVTEVASAGLTIVSGFMYGVDAAAHKAALTVGGKTIAVMPCGIDLIHPSYQQDLYCAILNNEGLVMSEYEGMMQPSNWKYPRRNRIVAGLARAILVIEAGEKSGSLISANWAKKFKRNIFAVPGPITSEVSKGTNWLLKQGAIPAVSAKDILDFYGFPLIVSKGLSEDQDDFDALEKKIIGQLKRESLDIDNLARNLGIPVSVLGTKLSLMHLRGLVQQDGPRYYIA